MRGPAFFAYADNYLVDVKFGVIVDVEATRAIRQAEVGAAKTMIDRTEQRLGLKPQRLAADSFVSKSNSTASLRRLLQHNLPIATLCAAAHDAREWLAIIYSITSSASATTVGGSSSPIDFAVFKLITNR